MALSPRFRDMQTRLTELRKHMLPASFSPTGDYSSRQLDRARGYKLLVHAEIENYIEDASMAVVSSAIAAWKKNKSPTIAIVGFIASYNSGWGIDGTFSPSRDSKLEDVDAVLDAASKQYMHSVRQNHGIREDNLKKMLLPTGLDLKELDSAWLTDIDSFGNSRGVIAHKSHAQHQIDPQDEFKKVKRLVEGLKKLDMKLENLKC